MRHMIIALALVAAIAAIAAESQALGTFNVTSAHITKQLSGAYRLRVEVDWDRTTYPNIAEPFLSDYRPSLTRFEFSEPAGSFNFYNTYGTGNTIDTEYDHRNDWGGWSAINTGTLGTSFGLDFYSTDTDLTSMSFNYFSQINYWSTGQLPTGENVGYGGGTHNITGSFSAQVVPEPSTLLLLGLGLVGAFRMRRKM